MKKLIGPFPSAARRWNSNDRQEWYRSGTLYLDPEIIVSVSDAPAQEDPLVLQGITGVCEVYCVEDGKYHIAKPANEVAEAVNAALSEQ